MRARNEERVMRARNEGRVMRRRAALAALLATPALAQPQPFPNRYLRIIVPYPPGGSAEAQARMVGERMAGLLGQPVVIENKPGAGATIATAYVAQQPADGYTLLLASTSHTITPALYQNLSYDAVGSFAPLSLLSTSPLLLLVRSDGPATLAELIARAKARPGALTYSTSGIGASPHLSAELFRLMARIEVTHVPFNGSAPAATALLGGHVDFCLGDASALPILAAGQLRCLAVTTAGRSADLPGVPAFAETLPGYEVTNWSALLAPAGTPAAVVALLNRQIRAVLDQPEVRQTLAQRGFQAAPTTPEELRLLMQAERLKYATVVRDAGIRLG